jgi:hypothetical protein
MQRPRKGSWPWTSRHPISTKQCGPSPPTASGGTHSSVELGEGHVQHPGVMRGDGSAQESPECRVTDQKNRRTPMSIVCGWSPPSYGKLCSQVKYRRADRRLLCGRLSRCTFHCLLSILNTTCFRGWVTPIAINLSPPDGCHPLFDILSPPDGCHPLFDILRNAQVHLTDATHSSNDARHAMKHQSLWLQGFRDISGNMGLVSAGRINKDTPPLTTPSYTSKSSAMDTSSHIFQIVIHEATKGSFHPRETPRLV